MRQSKFFIPITRDVIHTQLKSQEFLTRGGYIMQEAAGRYVYLPLGNIVLNKIKNIINYHMTKNGFYELSIPTIQNADEWKKVGVLDSMIEELLHFQDHNKSNLLYCPTAEIPATKIAQHFLKNEKAFPLVFYQNQIKYRDEIRPRGGLLRGREFIMHDAYSFCLDDEKKEHLNIYKKIHSTYIDIFQSFSSPRVSFVYAQGDPGAIGGKLNHEVILLCKTEGTPVYIKKKFSVDSLYNKEENQENSLYTNKHFVQKNNIEEIMEDAGVSVDIINNYNINDFYELKGIEVGHLFCFDNKYSAPLGFRVNNKNVLGGSYGIGISRIIAGIVEASHDENGICWPENLSPFNYHLLFLTPESESLGEEIYEKLKNSCDILFDDRSLKDTNASVKLVESDLLGISQKIIVGRKIQILDRLTKEEINFSSCDELVQYIINKKHNSIKN